MRSSRIITEDSKKFTLKMQKKLAVLFFMILLAFIGLNVRLMKINKESGDKYKKQVLSQQRYDSIALPAKRGDIVDRKGSRLAFSEKVYNVIIDANLMLSEKGKYVDTTISAIVSCFPQINEGEVRAFIAENPSSKFKIWTKQLPYDEISPFLEQQNNIETASGIRGVWFQESYIRSYPYGSLACDVLGFTQNSGESSYGLEEFYNSTLNGINGREYGYLNDDSALERTIKPAVDGNTLITTIDTNIQSIVEKHILAFNEKHKDEVKEGNGSKNTGVIIMDPNSGEILALASYPVFDLNNPKDYELLKNNYTDEEIEAMDDTKKQEALNAVWKSFCISDTYEPGSTAKPLTIAIGLETGKLQGSESYECSGFLEVGDHKIGCNSTHGVVSVEDALASSCNVALMKMGAGIGRSTFFEFQSIFNMGLKTGIDLAGETRTDSLVFPENMTPTDLAVGSFGQGYNVSMIQLITAFSSVINGGTYYEPHIVSKIVNSNGATVETIEPRVLKQTVSAATSQDIRQYCKAAVMGAKGTGKSARPAGYQIGGKTGTAEKFPRKQGKYVASFIGYAPADNPQIAIYTVVDEPNVPDQAHATYATEITKNILTEVLPYMNIFMTEGLSDSEKEELQEKQLTFSEGAAGTQEETGESAEGEIVEVETAEGEENKQGAENSQSGENKTEESENTGSENIDSETLPDNTQKTDPETGKLIDSETGEVTDTYPSLLE